MNTTISELKRRARQSLTGHYKNPCYTFLLAILIPALLTLILESVSGLGAVAYTPRPSQYIVYYLASFIINVLSALLLCGRYKIHLDITVGKTTSGKDLFFAFRFYSDKFVLASIRFMLVLFLCALPAGIYSMLLMPSFRQNATGIVTFCILTIAGSIIALIYSLTYALVFFLLIEHPELSVQDAFFKSRMLMKGHKWKFFILTLSFIGWYFLGILTLFAGFVWIIPYVTQTYIEFYKELTAHESMPYKQ